MQISKAISLVCSLFVLSLFAILLVAAGCGLRVSSTDFPVLKLSTETRANQAQ